MAGIPPSFRDLFERDIVATVATIDPTGAPHLTPMWVDYDPDSGHVLLNTVRGRRKERNLRRDPRVGLTVVDPDAPSRYLSLQGEVVDVTADGAFDHLNALGRRYKGIDDYAANYRGEVERVVVRVKPNWVVFQDP